MAADTGPDTDAGGENALGRLETINLVSSLRDQTTPVMVLDTDLKFVFANKAYLKNTDRTMDDLAGRYVFDVFPEVPERIKVVERKFRRALAGVPTNLRAQPYNLERADGTVEVRHWRATQEPLRDAENKIAFMMQRAEDVTDAIVAKRERALVAQELDHRTKNVMAVVQAMTRMASREYATKEEFADDIIGRISAMSRNHARLYQNDFQGMRVRELIRDELTSLTSKVNFTLSGHDATMVNTHTARDLSMVVHELATNAAKYGCFAVKSGQLAVAWDVVDDHLVINWRESGCGPTPDVKNHGFGTKLLRMVRNIDVLREGTDDGLHAMLTCTDFRAKAAKPDSAHNSV